MLATLVLPFLIAGAVLPTPAPPKNAYAIYRAAMQHLGTLQQPKYIIDTEHWVALATGGNGDAQPAEWDERRIFNSDTRRECVLSVPYTPREPQIGESYFAPDSWLIRHPSTFRPKTSEETLQPDLSDIRTIANVVSIAKPSYEIRLAGVDSLTHGGSAYHLVLHPLADGKVHNLRELWINAATGYIMRAVIEGYYRPTYQSVAADTFVTEDFGRVGNYWLVIHHVWTYREPFSSVTYQYNATSLTMQFPQTMPDWFFDSKMFSQHFGDVTAIVGP